MNTQNKPAEIQPCPCEYWKGVTQGLGTDDDPPMVPQALYDPQTGRLDCIECGAPLQIRVPS